MKECMDSENLHRRLKKISGQVNAIDRMIDEDIPCEQILMQVNAVKSALHKVGHIIVEGHLEHCVKDAIEQGDADDALGDISTILEYYSRI
ncbi:MAG: metal-sensing transcriptional repressor [Methanobrevibacter sp.]|nr:metal-sensing transcriptional repressor [Methanobrevibacter sp.]MBR1610303.1 metal-sensing transcriptional repressor [Methanobrevibacter sp.]